MNYVQELRQSTLNWLIHWLETLKGTRRDDTARALGAQSLHAKIDNLQMRDHYVRFHNKVFEAAHWFTESTAGPVNMICAELGLEEHDRVLLRAPITSYICSLIMQEFEDTLRFKILVDQTNPVWLMPPLSYSRAPYNLDALLSRGTEDISASITNKFVGSLGDIMHIGLGIPSWVTGFWRYPTCPSLLSFRALIRECVDAFVPLVDGVRLGLCFRARGPRNPMTRLFLYLRGFQRSPSELKSYPIFPEYIRLTHMNKPIQTIEPECRVKYIEGTTRAPWAWELNGIARDVGDI